tara:strand:- start:746 stop:1600 length:855 start_codon:yes stop_codon:yes gene_type:complete
MSGASALAAAKRRRSKVDSSRSTTNTSSSARQNTSNNVSGSNMPPRLTVQQSFQYMWQKILQVESMVNNNTINMKSTTSNNNNNNNNFEVNDLRQKINILENSVKQFSSNASTNSVEVNGEKFVSIEQFNEVMSKVATDMQGITEKVAQLSEYVSNVQNNNVVLRNILDSMESQNFGFDGTNSVGLSVESNENSSINEESVNEDDVVNEVVDNDDEVVEDGGDDGDDDGNENNNVSATPDVSSVLEKLKTLNSEDIKQEVTAELNNNITLVVEENSNNSNAESV